MTTTTAAWESLTGRRGVDIGTSFTRAWNERIGKTAKRSKDYPNPEYYSLRYNFKPESIDNENTGTLTPKPGGSDGRTFELERPSQQHGESHRFTAVEQPSKEWECVLLWDPVLQQLTLEKLESALNLQHEGRGGTKGRPPSATPPRAPRTASTSQGRASPPADPADADAEGEPDDELEFQAALDAAALKQEEEEDDDDDDDEMEAVEVAPPPPPPPPKPKRGKRERDEIEEEVLAFGEPTTRAKRPRRASATYGSGVHGLGLALPTGAAPRAAPTPSELLQPPQPPPHPYEADSEDSDGGLELGEELDAAALELELEQTLAEEEEEEEEEDMEAVPLENGHHDTGRPLSLNELFGGQSDDDDTSSDDSDDD